VISTLKKASSLVQVNPLYLKDAGKPREVRLEPTCLEAELDEQWSFASNKSNQLWLWYAVDHATNTVLAYVFGKRMDTTVLQDVKALLAPLNIGRYYTWIKRLARRSICFPKLEKMHDIVLGCWSIRSSSGVIFMPNHRFGPLPAIPVGL
jgi:IS1 family transposase